MIKVVSLRSNFLCLPAREFVNSSHKINTFLTKNVGKKELVTSTISLASESSSKCKSCKLMNLYSRGKTFKRLSAKNKLLIIFVDAHLGNEVASLFSHKINDYRRSVGALKNYYVHILAKHSEHAQESKV